MTTNAEIESIVRRVLSGMLAAGSSSAAIATKVTVDASSILRLQQKLITLSSIPRDLAGISEIHIQTKAVVTPAVRDLLRIANTTIIRGSTIRGSTAKPNSEAPNPTESSTLTSLPSLKSLSSFPPLIIAGSTAFMPAINRSICPKQAKTLPQSQDDATALREATIGLRSGHRAAVIIGSSAHAISWQAARDEKLRPVVISQWMHLAETLAEVPTNLVILSTKYWNAPAACNVIRAFYKHITQS